MNEGKLIAGGFAAYLTHKKIPVTDPIVTSLYELYMAGAEHLWSSIMTTLDPGTMETDADMKRMDSIQAEIDTWRKIKIDAFAKAAPTKGNA